jgi:hypothetical protein
VTLCPVLPPPSEPAPLPPASEIGVLMAGLPGVPARLIAAHVPDARGHCRGCTLAQGAPPVWPCRLVLYAREASRVHRARGLPDR